MDDSESSSNASTPLSNGSSAKSLLRSGDFTVGSLYINVYFVQHHRHYTQLST